MPLPFQDLPCLIRTLGSLKIWNVKTTACIRTLDCGHAICSTFLPNDRQVSGSCEINQYHLMGAVHTDRSWDEEWRDINLRLGLCFIG